MLFSYNRFHQLETPQTFLAYPNKEIICALKPYGRKTSLCFNNISEYTFSINKYVNGQKTPHYDDITVSKYIEFKNIAWFRIENISKDGDGKNEVATITALALESETGQTYITSLGSLGVTTDEDGGLDMYCLYNSIDIPHSIMHLFIEKNPSWSIGYIDPDISKEYRIFNEDRIASYDFLVSTVSEAFECIFQFDTYTKTVSVHKLENIGKVTSIYLAYRNLIKSVKITCDATDYKTKFTVTGGSDATGTPLMIADVNPSGNNEITNFKYCFHDMSNQLQDKLIKYTNLMEQNAPLYQKAISDLQVMYDELGTLKNAHAETENSTDWAKYGSVALESKAAVFRNVMSVHNENSNGTIYQEAYRNFTAVSAELALRKTQISNKETQIASQKELIQSYVINIADYLGTALYKELSVHVKEDTFVDDSFISTEKMTDSDIFKMKIALYEHAKKRLEKVCSPQFTMDVDAINFPAIFRYKKYTDQLALGNIITIHLDDGYDIEARLLQISFNWDDHNDFSLTFSSKTSLENGVFDYENYKKLVDKIGSSLNLSSSAWNAATHSSATILTDMSTFLNATQREIQNSVDNEVNIDGTGITIRKVLGNGSFDPNQLWMTRGNIAITDDGWKSIKIAIGGVTVNGKKLYGIAAPLLIGQQILSENMQIINNKQNFEIGVNGLIAKASNNFSVSINPNTPSAIFTIKNGSNTVLGVDAATSKFVFKGTLESTDGKIGGFTIGSSALTAGTVGLASSGNIQIWSGNANAANAPFRVYKDGSIYTNKIEITGGSFKIGNNFSVDSSGNMKCSNADIAGKITALVGGKIGAFSITQDGLRADNERVSINWGNFQVSGHEATIGSITLSNDGIEAGYIGGDNYAHWDSDTGGIYASEYYPTDDSWWAGDGLLETVKNLYNYVHGGGWNPCGSDDCSDSGGCDGGGCETCSSNDCTSFDSCVQVCPSDDCNSCSDSGPIPCSGDGCDGMEGPGCV